MPGDAPSAEPGSEWSADLANFVVRQVPFDEWVDVDTLLHRSSLTSGDFDYALRPLCPECGVELELEYETLDLHEHGGQEVISALVCGACRLLWEPEEADARTR